MCWHDGAAGGRGMAAKMNKPWIVTFGESQLHWEERHTRPAMSKGRVRIEGRRLILTWEEQGHPLGNRWNLAGPWGLTKIWTGWNGREKTWEERIRIQPDERCRAFWGLDLVKYDCVCDAGCGGRGRGRDRIFGWEKRLGKMLGVWISFHTQLWVGGQNATWPSISSLIAGFSGELDTALRDEGGNNHTVLLGAS